MSGAQPYTSRFEKECQALQKESKAYLDAMRGAFVACTVYSMTYYTSAAMTGAQTRIADHISVFYTAADRTSEGAMARHAYKQSVAELDDVIGRELVRRLACSCELIGH